MRLLSLLLSSLCLLPSTASIEAITAENPLVGGQRLKSSPDGTFVLGFFSHNSDGDGAAASAGIGRYLGIWYGKIPEFTVVWTANPDHPVPSNSTGILEIGPNGDLRVSDRKGGTPLWSSGRSNGTAANRVARLYDSGNLILMERTTGQDVLQWQSSDHLFDTLTSGMKLGWDLRSGLNRYLRSWGGQANYSFDLHGVPQLFMQTEVLTVRLGFWDGLNFINRPRPTPTPDQVFRFNYNESKDEVYYSVVAKKPSNLGRLKLVPSGKLYRYVWDEDRKKWKEYWNYPGETCDEYSLCGTFGVCTPDVAACSCLPGFDNERADELNMRDGHNRCIRRTQLDCSGHRDGFQMVPNLKLPDSRNATAWPDIGLDECSQKCLSNCSCTAYSLLYFVNGTRCITWFGDLRDIRAFTSGGLSLYLRLAASDIHTDPIPALSKRKKKLIVAVVVATVCVGVLLLAFGLYSNDLKSKRKLKKQGTVQSIDQEQANECPLPSYTFMTITIATADFHPENKLGQGAFGPVYQGELPNGEQIAVKRLSKSSRQGPKEFSNEIALIAKLQHKNLVRLLGCCVHGDERMLIYELMPNKCLSSFLFDDEKCKSLDWKLRAEIITGIARGVDYLHHGSRLRIVHRDLKVGNILLDQKMNPKISDFGTAKTFEQEVMKDSTVNVIGTYGYMAPEYVIDGIFSTKSDVYSFGIIVLEILTGVKNKVLQCMETTLTLPGYAWKLWNEGDIRNLVDSRVVDPCPVYILRYIHVALLCVQEDANDRPEMYEAIIMLGSESMELPQPKKPGFYTKISSSPNIASFSTRPVSSTMAHITHTDLQAR